MYLGPVVVAQQVLDPSPQTSYPKEKKGGHICYNQVFRSLIPGSRYRFTSQDVTGIKLSSIYVLRTYQVVINLTLVAKIYENSNHRSGFSLVDGP